MWRLAIATVLAMLVAGCTSADIGADAASSDGASVDLSVRDAEPDAFEPDSAVSDAGSTPPSTPEGGSTDAGPPDASAPDAAPADAGPSCGPTQVCTRPDETTGAVACSDDESTTCLADIGLRYEWCACGLPALYFDPPPGASDGAPLRHVIVVSSEAALTLNIGGICRAGMPSTGCDLGCSSGSYAWRWDVSDLGYRTPVGALVVTGADISCFGGTYLLEGDWRP